MNFANSNNCRCCLHVCYYCQVRACGSLMSQQREWEHISRLHVDGIFEGDHSRIRPSPQFAGVFLYKPLLLSDHRFTFLHRNPMATDSTQTQVIPTFKLVLGQCDPHHTTSPTRSEHQFDPCSYDSTDPVSIPSMPTNSHLLTLVS